MFGVSVPYFVEYIWIFSGHIRDYKVSNVNLIENTF